MTVQSSNSERCPSCGQAIQDRQPEASKEGIERELRTSIAANEKAPEAVVIDRQYATEIGIVLDRLMRSWDWPRRQIPNRLHHLIDRRIDQGLVLREPDRSVIDFHENYLDEVLGDDPSYRWISSFGTNCRRGLAQTPSDEFYERLARFDLVLRVLGLK